MGVRLCLLTLALLTSPGQVGAENVDPVEVDRARRHFQAGSAYFEEGKFDDAVREFRIAYGLSHRPELLYNVAKAYLRKGDAARASEAFTEYLQLRPDAIDRPGIELLLADLERRVGLVRVVNAPPGSDVIVDDRTVGRAPLLAPIRVTVGRRSVVAQPPDGTPARQVEVTVMAGREVIADVPPFVEKVVVKVVHVPERGQRWFNSKLGWGLTASGVAVAVGGAVLLGVGSSRVRSAPDAADQAGYYARRDEGMAMEESGVSLLVVGGAAIVAGAAVFAWRARRPEPRRSVWLVPSGTGILAGGAF